MPKITNLQSLIKILQKNYSMLSVNLQPAFLQGSTNKDCKVILSAQINEEGTIFYFNQESIVLDKESLETFKAFIEETIEKTEAFKNLLK